MYLVLKLHETVIRAVNMILEGLVEHGVVRLLDQVNLC